jgi:thiosulfate/3-mercaptopyruvate sulfurtransferase
MKADVMRNTMKRSCEDMSNSGAGSRVMRRLAGLALACCIIWPAAMQAQSKPATPSGVNPRLRSDLLVSTDWLADHLNNPDVVVLCIAGKPEFCSAGRIPGARFISLSSIAVTRDGVPNELPAVGDLQRVFAAAGVKDGSRIILYGERYGLFAARAYFTLDYLGLGDHAALLNGGLEKWKAEKRPLSAEEPKPVAGKLTVKANPDILLNVRDMQTLALEKSGSAAILDARPDDEFTGAKLSEEVSRAGHIPHAAGLFWMKNLESTANPVLRPEAELRRMYSALGAGPQKKVVSYCRSGMQSSFDYFVAKYLGYDTGMYDGSFFEWSRNGLPVESDQKK